MTVAIAVEMVVRIAANIALVDVVDIAVVDIAVVDIAVAAEFEIDIAGIVIVIEIVMVPVAEVTMFADTLLDIEVERPVRMIAVETKIEGMIEECAKKIENASETGLSLVVEMNHIVVVVEMKGDIECSIEIVENKIVVEFVHFVDVNNTVVMIGAIVHCDSERAQGVVAASVVMAFAMVACGDVAACIVDLNILVVNEKNRMIGVEFVGEVVSDIDIGMYVRVVVVAVAVVVVVVVVEMNVIEVIALVGMETFARLLMKAHIEFDFAPANERAELMMKNLTKQERVEEPVKKVRAGQIQQCHVHLS